MLAIIAARLPVGRFRPALHELGVLAGFFVGVGPPGLVSNLTKRLIGRARPEYFQDLSAFHFQLIFNVWSFQSFPSGHSTTNIATALVLDFASPRWFRLILPIAVMTMLSRVVIGMHYTTDVVAGMVLGALGAYAVRNFFARRGLLFTVRSEGSVRFRGLPNLRRLIRGLAPPIESIKIVHSRKG
ncbi:MAG: phosphatase PAP2 family protein [Candidatus Devosia euplotis]|nr:phosphatase PAP2 family protein [Candidatus Devosia euplotis]